MRSSAMVWPLAVFWCVAGLQFAGHAAAFVLSDGTTTQCLAQGRVVAEIQAPPDHAIVKQGRIAVTASFGQGHQIVWNPKKLSELPPAMRDFLFFHECAHAQVPTDDEAVANCVGLIAMRAAGRAGADVEARLAAFYGPGNAYWQRTLQCAAASKVAPSGSAGPPS
jgi:hypothetical protein